METPLAAKTRARATAGSAPAPPPRPAPVGQSVTGREKPTKHFSESNLPQNSRKKREKTAKKAKVAAETRGPGLAEAVHHTPPLPHLPSRNQDLAPASWPRESEFGVAVRSHAKHPEKIRELSEKNPPRALPSPQAFCENSFACSPPGAPLCSTRGPEPKSRNRSGTQREDTETTRRQTETKAARQSQAPEVEHPKVRRKSAKKPHTGKQKPVRPKCRRKPPKSTGQTTPRKP